MCVSKESAYSFNGQADYFELWIECIIKELKRKEEKLLEEYKKRNRNNENKYEKNTPLFEYQDYIKGILRILSDAKKIYSESNHSSIEKFENAAIKLNYIDFETLLREIMSWVFVGEENEYEYKNMYQIGFSWNEEVESILINRYSVVFDVLLEKKRLYELYNSLSYSTFLDKEGNVRYKLANYYSDENEAGQKKKEMLYFLDHILDCLNKKITKDVFETCVHIMIRILYNPCVGTISVKTEENPEQINRFLSFIFTNLKAKRIVEDYLKDLDKDVDDQVEFGECTTAQIELGFLYGCSYIGDKIIYNDETAVKKIEKALFALKKVMEAGADFSTQPENPDNSI